MENLWKWFSEQWGHLITHHFEGMMVVASSFLGALIGLRQGEKVSLWTALTVVVTSATTTMFLALTLDYYFELPEVALYALCYFLGTVGNKITLAFILLIAEFLKNPKAYIKILGEILMELIKLRK